MIMILMESQTFLEFWIREASHIVKDYFIFAASAFILFYVLFKRPMWFRKVQQKLPAVTDYGRDIMYSLMSVTIFATVGLSTFYFLGDYTHTYRHIADYGYVYYAFTWVWMFFLHDTYFYWMHRGMHHPVLFKYVHLVHHKSTNPSPWTAYAFHPLEAVLEAAILPLIAFTLPVHKGTIGMFFLFQIIYNVYGHLGFELYPRGFHKTLIGRWVNTSVAHNLHHDKFHGNYGLYFLFWDRIMGTLRSEYDAVYERTTEGEREKEISKSHTSPLSRGVLG